MNNIDIEDVIAAIKQVRDKAEAQAATHPAGSQEWVIAKGQQFGAADCIDAVHRLYMDTVSNPAG